MILTKKGLVKRSVIENKIKGIIDESDLNSDSKTQFKEIISNDFKKEFVNLNHFQTMRKIICYNNYPLSNIYGFCHKSFSNNEKNIRFQ